MRRCNSNYALSKQPTDILERRIYVLELWYHEIMMPVQTEKETLRDAFYA